MDISVLVFALSSLTCMTTLGSLNAIFCVASVNLPFVRLSKLTVKSKAWACMQNSNAIKYFIQSLFPLLRIEFHISYTRICAPPAPRKSPNTHL